MSILSSLVSQTFPDAAKSTACAQRCCMVIQSPTLYLHTFKLCLLLYANAQAGLQSREAAYRALLQELHAMRNGLEDEGGTRAENGKENKSRKQVRQKILVGGLCVAHLPGKCHGLVIKSRPILYG
eukprot:1159185-Pelagomonas_calceolata.AAC.4